MGNAISVRRGEIKESEAFVCAKESIFCIKVDDEMDRWIDDNTLQLWIGI